MLNKNNSSCSSCVYKFINQKCKMSQFTSPAHKHLVFIYFLKEILNKRSILTQVSISLRMLQTYKETKKEINLVCYSVSSNATEQCFLFTLDLCCFWSSCQSHLCRTCSDSSPLSTIMPFPLAVYTSWQATGLNLQDSLQVVSARKGIIRSQTFVAGFE